jgi:hypothetical protein
LQLVHGSLHQGLTGFDRDVVFTRIGIAGDRNYGERDALPVNEQPTRF